MLMFLSRTLRKLVANAPGTRGFQMRLRKMKIFHSIHPAISLARQIVKESADLHVGTIDIEDTSGGGATFKLSFTAATDA